MRSVIGATVKQASYTSTRSTQLLHVQQRTFITQFAASFKKNLQRNLENEPDFGGQLKRLQQQSTTVISKTTSSTGEVASSISNAINQSLDNAQKLSDPIINSKSVKNTSDVLKSAAELLADGVVKIGDPIASHPLAQKIDELFTPEKSKFCPDPNLKFKPEQMINQCTDLVVSKESMWGSWRTNMSNKWQQLSETENNLGFLLEKINSLGRFIKSLSTSKIGRIVGKVRESDPDFNLIEFQKWIETEFYPMIIAAEKLDEYLEKHTSEVIHKMWEENFFPLHCRVTNVSFFQIFPLDETEGNGFALSLKSQILEKKTDLYNLHVVLVVKQNVNGVWILNNFEIMDKKEAFF